MANMNNFDDKNLFDDDFDLLSESADSLFGAPAQQNVQNKRRIGANQHQKQAAQHFNAAFGNDGHNQCKNTDWREF